MENTSFGYKNGIGPSPTANNAMYSNMNMSVATDKPSF
jgi:hypothetical protein